MALIKKIIPTVLIFGFISTAEAAVWSDFAGRVVKNGLASTERANETNMLVSPSGKKYIAFQNRKDRIFVREFSGEKWVDLPGSVRNKFLVRNGMNPELAEKDGVLFVAFSDWDAGKKTRVMKWNGDSWSALPDGAHPDGYISESGGFEPVIEFDRSGENLFVAFRDETSGERIKVMRWSENSGWENVSDANFPDGIVSQSVASEVDLSASKVNNGIYVAFEDIANGTRVRVLFWDGSSWQNLSDADHPEGLVSSVFACSPSIDSDISGNLYLTYTGRNERNTYVQKWNGSKWEFLGGETVVFGKTIESAIAADSRGYLYLAYSQKSKNAWRVRAKVWNGSRWIDANDGKSKNVSRGKGKGDPSLAVFENRLYMSFTDARSKNKARVKILTFNP